MQGASSCMLARQTSQTRPLALADGGQLPRFSHMHLTLATPGCQVTTFQSFLCFYLCSQWQARNSLRNVFGQ